MGRKRPEPVEPCWAPLPRERFTPAQTASIVARHAVPLVLLWCFGGSVLQFLLLCVFNIAFTIAGIGTVGVAVSTRQEVGEPRGSADRIGAWVMLGLVCVGASLLLTALFGWVLAVLASEEAEGLWNSSLWWSVLAIVVGALPGMFLQFEADLRDGLGEEQRKQRDQPAVGVQLFSAMAIALLSIWTLGWGRLGGVLMALAVTALFIFRDLRPDLARELTRPSNRPPKR